MLVRITGLLKKLLSNRMRKASVGKATIQIGRDPLFMSTVELHPNQPDKDSSWGEGNTVRFAVLLERTGPDFLRWIFSDTNFQSQDFYVSTMTSSHMTKYKGQVEKKSLMSKTDDYMAMMIEYRIIEIVDDRMIKEDVIDKSHASLTVLSLIIAAVVSFCSAWITGSNAVGVACGIAMLQLYAGICRQIIVLSERDNAGEYKPVSFWFFIFLFRSNAPRSPVGNLYERDWRGLAALLRGASYFMGAGLLLTLIAQNGGGALLGRLLPGG